MSGVLLKGQFEEAGPPVHKIISCKFKMCSVIVCIDFRLLLFLPCHMQVDEYDEDMFGEVNKCHLVWEGTVQKPAFSEFIRERCTTEHAARQTLAKAGVVHYWDTAKNFQVTSEI